MIYLKKSKNIFVSLLFSGSVNSNLYSGCCPCNKNEKNNNPSEGTDNQVKDKDKKDKEKDKGKDKGKDKDKKDKEKDNDKKQQEQNNNVIYNLEGVVGLTCKLENNKVCLYTKVSGNKNYKFGESTEAFNGEFNYEKFKDLRINIKIDEFGINWEDCCTIEGLIIGLRVDWQTIKDFKFLQNKIIFLGTGDEGGYSYLNDLSDMKVYRNITKPNSQVSFLLNVDISNPEDFKDKSYGIAYNEKYFKLTGTGKGYDDSDENQAEYKTKFLNGE